MQSKGEIAFVYAKENDYPLAYLRAEGEEKILVVINPAAREVSFECAYEPKKMIYSFGGEVALADGKMTVPAQSVEFLNI